MELAHLSEVAQHTRPQAAVLDTPMLHSRIIPRGKAPTKSLCQSLPWVAPAAAVELAPELAEAL